MTMFIFWELTSISSYLLIGFDHEKSKSRSAALQALLITGGGGLALLAGLILLALVGGSWEISTLMQSGDVVRQHPLYLPILLLVLLGAFTKSAQFPFHFWLPGAMAAPTPISAYLHSATMVKAGIYLLARLNPALGGTDEWHYLITLAGATTMLAGALLALPQTDLKRLLAYSTVSALGTLTLLLGLDTTLSMKAAIVFLLVHSLYKGGLFMVAGNIDHETGTRDVRRLGGLVRLMPLTALAAGLAALSMVGFPPLLGFIGKEIIYEAKTQAPNAAPFITAAGVLSNVLMVAVAGIVGLRPFLGKRGDHPQKAHEAPLAMWLGPLLLGGLGLFIGLLPDQLAQGIVGPAVSAIEAEPTAVKITLWHGFNVVLLLSVVTVASGVAVFLARKQSRTLAARLDFLTALTPDRLFSRGLAGLIRLAGLLTGLLQNGYLRSYLLTIVSAAVGLVGYTLVTQTGLIGTDLTGAAAWGDIRFHEVAVTVMLLVGILFVVRATSRLSAVVGLGAIGFGMSLLYLLFSAPDLAMTQLATETLTVILLVFILYRLPRFSRFTQRADRLRDGLIAIAAGGLVTVLVLVVAALPTVSRLTPFFAESSLPLAKGRNVVNVILVDFRALDTLGEITVLAVAAIGVYALLKLSRTSSYESEEE
jgi:multicomponent Na+:H+ antiporter subunit A